MPVLTIKFFLIRGTSWWMWLSFSKRNISSCILELTSGMLILLSLNCILILYHVTVNEILFGEYQFLITLRLDAKFSAHITSESCYMPISLIPIFLWILFLFIKVKREKKITSYSKKCGRKAPNFQKETISGNYIW